MTKATFYFSGGIITGFRISGHTADSDTEEGRLICAAVSSAAYMAANTVTDVVGAPADAVVSDGEMLFTLKKSDRSSQSVLQGLKLHLESLSQQYVNYIAVNTEVQHNA